MIKGMCILRGLSFIDDSDGYSGNYNIYLNFSHDFGKTRLKENMRIDKAEPGKISSLQIDCDNNGTVHVVWT